MSKLFDPIGTEAVVGEDVRNLIQLCKRRQIDFAEFAGIDQRHHRAGRRDHFALELGFVDIDFV